MKKLYNNTLLQLILALCTFSFVACQEFGRASQHPDRRTGVLHRFGYFSEQHRF